jgi:hypothetical protein
MFSLPPAGINTEDMIDGCPVVDLLDNKDDFAALLHAIYDGPYVTLTAGFIPNSRLTS